LIDWDKSAVDIHNLIRGLHPWPHAFSFLDGARYILLRSAVVELPLAITDGLTAVGGGSEPRQAGAVVEAEGDRLVVIAGAAAVAGRAGESQLRILEIQPEGKRPLTAREFLAGHHIPARAAFSATP
jgi:methionyl-tRNA formyltransferase